MAWNGSEQDKAKGQGEGRAKRRGQVSDKYHHSSRNTRHASLKYGAIAGLAAVALGVAAVLWFFTRHENDNTSDKRVERHPSKIAEVKPQIVTNRTEAIDKKSKELTPQRVGESRNGKVLMPNGELRPIKGEVTNSTAKIKAPYAIFRHPSENIIAGILVAEPGKGMVGTPRYNGVFTKNFLKSCEEPIVVKETDDEDTKALKRAVNEAKIELKAAYDRGEDIEQLVLDSRKELQRLAKVREEMKRDVVKIAAQQAESPEEVDDLLSAANKMLEDNGIAPLDKTPLTNVKLRLMREQEIRNAEKENAK